MNRTFSLVIVCVCAIFLPACSPPSKVAVTERSTVDRNVAIDNMGGSLVRHIQPGETLYSIAFDLGLNVNDVAAWNNLTDTTRLQIGQKIRLTKPLGFVVATAPSSPRKLERSQSNQSAGERSPASVGGEVRTRSQHTSTNATVTGPTHSQETSWQWPLVGKVVRRFSTSDGQQGIDIQARDGHAVRATSAGDVVYVGNSLKGYGNLVIVKHSDEYISAYAHNKEIFVREGEQVESQQRIGSVGLNRYQEPAIHFQIRQNGLPVNPLLYLPKLG